MQRARDLKKACHQRITAVGSYPEDYLVVLSVAIGIFEDDLRFADPAQAADSLWLGHRLTGEQLASQSDKHLFTSQEEQVAWVGKRPCLLGYFWVNAFLLVG